MRALAAHRLRVPEDEQSSFNDYLRYLLACHVDAETAAGGITKQVIGRGLQTLSEKQRFVFETEVLADFGRRCCLRCDTTIPWSEMVEGLDRGVCSWCLKSESKD